MPQREGEEEGRPPWPNARSTPGLGTVLTNSQAAIFEVVCVVECPHGSLHGLDHIARGLDLVWVGSLEGATGHRIHFCNLQHTADSITNPITHTFTHTPAQSLTHSLTHPPTHPSAQSPTHTLTHLPTRLPNHLLTHVPNSSTHPHLTTHSLTHSCTSYRHSTVHSY